MNSLRSFLVTLSAICTLANPSFAQLAAQEYTPDAHTVLLDHFNGSALTEYSTGVQYINGFSGLHQAAAFPTGSWAREAFPAWFTWTNPSAPEGTVELWIKPEQYDTGILTMQWFQTNSAPPAGYIFHLGLDPNGKLTIGGWNSVASGAGNIWSTPYPTGNATVPLDTWTHIAFTWGQQGSHTFVNGEQDAFSLGNYYPGFDPTVYLYLNYWGSSSLGTMDELRISNIARTQFDTIVHPVVVPEPGAFAALFIGCLTALPFLHRRKR